MDTNQDILQGRWPELKGQVKQQWSKLTNDDLGHLSGKNMAMARFRQKSKLTIGRAIMSSCAKT